FAQRLEFARAEGQVVTAWRPVEEAAAAAGAPPRLRQAVARARTGYFGDLQHVRSDALADLAAGRPALQDPDHANRTFREGLDTMVGVAATAMDLMAERAADRAETARREAALALLLVA